ncbi:MAG: hypothetical protein ACYS76_02365 [Planctomycetota bacterium]|jgi:hypothetical protein
MNDVTLAVAVAASLLVLCLRPALGFAVYVTLLFWYPTYLVLRLGSLDISASRIVVAVLLLRCAATPGLTKRFKWCALDTWVTLTAAACTVIPLLTWHMPFMKNIENKAGFLLDSYCAYMAARCCIASRADLVTAVKWIALVMVSLAFLGVVESATGWQPFIRLKQYCPWENPGSGVGNARFGFERAVGPAGHPILFGASFVMFIPMVYSLRHSPGPWRKLAFLFSGALIAGAFSSLSNVVWVMVILTIFCLALENRPQWIKPILISLALSYVCVSIISNRSVHHVVMSYGNLAGGCGWHRAKLIDCTIADFSQWWLVGYRGRDPGWGRSVGMSWSDITNGYILIAWRAGLLGLIAFCGIFASALRLLYRSWKYTKNPAAKSWYWALGTVIVVLIVSLNGFHPFAQAQTLFNCAIGMTGSSVLWVPKPVSLRRLTIGTRWNFAKFSY